MICRPLGCRCWSEMEMEKKPIIIINLAHNLLQIYSDCRFPIIFLSHFIIYFVLLLLSIRPSFPPQGILILFIELFWLHTHVLSFIRARFRWLSMTVFPCVVCTYFPPVGPVNAHLLTCLWQNGKDDMLLILLKPLMLWNISNIKHLKQAKVNF